MGYSEVENRTGAPMSTEGMFFNNGSDEVPATQSVSSKTVSTGRDTNVSKKSIRPARTLSALPSKLSDRHTQFIEELEPQHSPEDLILDTESFDVFDGLVAEFRQGEQLRRHGLRPRNKILFCGPPGCGKTLAADIFAIRTNLPFKTLRIDALISSYLGETATNLRTVFEEVLYRPVALFLDEFDAIAQPTPYWLVQ